MHFYNVHLAGEDEPRLIMAANRKGAYTHAVASYPSHARPLARSIVDLT